MSNQKRMVSPPMPPRGGNTARRTLWLVAIGLVVFLTAGMLALVGTAASQPSPPPPPPTSDAEPHIEEGFAQDLSGEERDPLPTPETFSHGLSVDGCDRGYGVLGECVPWNFPPAVGDDPAAKCEWLRQQGAGALEVPGEDRHGLVPAGGPRAPSGNPYACPGVLPTG